MDPELIQKLIPLVLTQAAAFLLFVWLLNSFAVKPVLRLLDERREKIASQFEEIDSEKKRVDSLKNDYEEHLRKIEDEARTRMLEEVNKGKRIAEDIAVKARADATATIEKAQAAVDTQVEQARAKLKRDVVEMVMTASEKLIRDRLDPERHRQMVASFVAELEKKRSGGPESN